MKTKKILENRIFKKTKFLLKKFLFIMLLVMILYNIIFFFNVTITDKKFLNIFGISIFFVETDAMEKDLYKNDLVIAKKISLNKVLENDIVIWNVNNNIKINKVIEIYNNNENGKKVYVTKFNKNYQPDIELLTEENIIGKKIISFRYIGILLKMLQSKITTIIIFIALCTYFIYNKKIYMRNKKRARKKIRYDMKKYEL